MQRKVLWLFIPILLLLAGAALAQQEDVPPQVIEVAPYPGVEMPLDAPLTLTFNQPMDQASVEAAWGIEPAIDGTFNWTDERTLVFTPSAGWARESEYTVTLANTAAASNALTLPDPYTFTVRTVGRLAVASVIPAPDTEGVAADAIITVAFNRPVVALSGTAEMDDLPNPLTLDPAVPGKGEWLNTTIYQFTPDEPLLGGATYTVTVNAGLTDLTGATLDEPYTWSFRTLVPEIFWYSPSPESGWVYLDQVIQVGFSQPMDRLSTEAAFSLRLGGEPVKGAFSWSDNDTVLTFTPAEPLQMDTEYRFILNAEVAQGLGGANLRQGRDVTFRTVPYPYILNTYPENGSNYTQPGYQAVSINFATRMNMDSLQGKIMISPEPEEWNPVIYSDTSLGLEFNFLANTTYTITILAGATDIYGNAIANDYTFSFMVGTVNETAYLSVPNQIVVTGAYRETTAVGFFAAGKPTVNMELYSMSRDSLAQAFSRGMYYDNIEMFRTENQLLRQWSPTLDAGDSYANVKVALDENFGVLPLGNYLVIASYTDPSGYTNTSPVAVIVANNTVTYKRMEKEVLVWVTDMETGQPLANQTVTIFARGEAWARGTTDEQGVLRLEVDLGFDNGEILIVAEGEGRYGIWASNTYPVPTKENVYFYTERPIYRPGETIYYKGVYRAVDDNDFFVDPTVTSLQVRATINYDTVLFDTTVTINEQGSFSGEFVLPEDARIGNVVFEVLRNGTYLTQAGAQIAEFRVPEFSVSATSSQEDVVEGDPIQAVINGTYFSGGAVSNASLTWNATASPTIFAYAGPGNYSFSEQQFFYYYDYGFGGYYGDIQLGSGEGRTDSAGNFVVEIPGSNTTLDGTDPYSVSIEGTLTDESGQFISGRTQVMLHPSEVYVGTRTDQYFAREGETIQAEVITVTPQSEIVPDWNVNLSLIERRWERQPIPGQFGQFTWQQTEIEVETLTVTTGADGKATHDFTLPNAGIFLVRAETRDLRERLHRSAVTFWVTGTASVWWGEPSPYVDLIPDKQDYVPGETAEIFIPLRFQGEGTSYALITVERNDVKTYEVVPIEGSSLVYEIPITEDYAPTIYVSAVVVHGIDSQNTTPVYITGTAQLNVDPVSKRLDLTVTPSDVNTQPGETVTLDIETKDLDGTPVSAEVSLALVDAAILSLAEPNSFDPETHYYSFASNFIYTETSLMALVDDQLDAVFGEEKDRDEVLREVQEEGLAADGAFDAVAAQAPMPGMGGGGGGGGGFAEVVVREDFQQTPLWEPHVVTDANGQAQVSVTMPDNLTIWHLTARAVTPDTLVGEQQLDIASTLPLLVRPAVPRFFVEGDEVTLAMVINNNTSAEQTVQTTMQGTGFELLDGDTLEKAVTIGADSRARVEWRVRILDVAGVDLTFIALGADGYQDAAKPALTNAEGLIPVYRYTAPDTTGTGGVLREDGSRTEGISIPPSVDDVDQGELVVQLDPSLAATTIDALDYLEEFRHACIEQTVSRFLPNIITYRALLSLNIDDPELKAQLDATLSSSIEKLEAAQNGDGGWGWFEGNESNPLVTAYAIYGLIEARDAGYPFDTSMIDRAVNFLRTDFISPNEDTDIWRLNRQAFYYFVLSRGVDKRYAVSLSELDALYQVRLELSYYAKAFLLMAYTDSQPTAQDQINALTSDLITAASLSATGAHWEEEYKDWYNWNTETRSTAIVLAALLKVDPQNELLPNAVRWLMVARQGDFWETTQETAWAVMSLTDWMVATNELQGNYQYSVALNGAEATTGQVTPETVKEGQELRIAVNELLQEELNRLSIIRGEGTGALYYTAHLQLRLDASEAEAIDRGVGITREYFVQGNTTAVTEAQTGDIITVRLTITIPETIYYFVLEDPIPAGTEALDTSLLTTTQAVEGPQLIEADRDSRYWWYWWIWDHTEIRDESVNLYADYLSPGTYVYSYQVQATAAGNFQTMPSHGYAFYFPEVFGRSDGELFVITPGTEE